MPYSLDDLRRARAPKPAHDDVPAGIPADAPHDTGEALGCWNGQRFVSWREWLVSRPVGRLSVISSTGDKPKQNTTRRSWDNKGY
jgi:hypothetical protein